MVRETVKDVDFALMRQIQNGDMVAFNTMVNRYKQRLMNVVSRMMSSTEEAEDIVQETFVRVHLHRHLFNYEFCFSTWIFTICLNLAKNELRKRKKYTFVDITELSKHGVELSVEPYSPSCLSLALDSAIRDLPEQYRTAFMLRDMQEMPYEEIGMALGVPTGTVKSRVSRARSVLRDQLQSVFNYSPRRWMVSN